MRGNVVYAKKHSAPGQRRHVRTDRARRAIGNMCREQRIVGDLHDAATESHRDLTRAVEDTNTALIQTSAGTAEDAGSSSRSADFRRRERARLEDPDHARRQRQLKVLELAVPLTLN